jgi:hypothetical protein
LINDPRTKKNEKTLENGNDASLRGDQEAEFANNCFLVQFILSSATHTTHTNKAIDDGEETRSKVKSAQFQMFAKKESSNSTESTLQHFSTLSEIAKLLKSRDFLLFALAL